MVGTILLYMLWFSLASFVFLTTLHLAYKIWYKLKQQIELITLYQTSQPIQHNNCHNTSEYLATNVRIK